MQFFQIHLKKFIQISSSHLRRNFPPFALAKDFTFCFRELRTRCSRVKNIHKIYPVNFLPSIPIMGMSDLTWLKSSPERLQTVQRRIPSRLQQPPIPNTITNAAIPMKSAKGIVRKQGAGDAVSFAPTVSIDIMDTVTALR